ncbi:MAG TPA: acetyl-CoA carboxylase carboxyl transferase subunit alpha, partial [Idiomarina sp.]|nr:acetyl-CoA carboxylase carboxyl transferase subunit alpha [Idiomarina sp.]
EPLGGAHRNMDDMATALKQRLITDLNELRGLERSELLDRRYQKLMSFGYC